MKSPRSQAARDLRHSCFKSEFLALLPVPILPGERQCASAIDGFAEQGLKQIQSADPEGVG